MNIIKIKKMISICLLIMMVISTISTVVMATTPSQITSSGADDIGTDTVNQAGRNLVSILQAVGIVLSVVILIIIGIKYMMGSAEEKAEYKKTLMPYVIGAALIFAASIFAQVVYDFFSGWGSKGTTIPVQGGSIYVP